MTLNHGRYRLNTAAPAPSDTSESRAFIPQIEQSFNLQPLSLLTNLLNGSILAAVLWNETSAARVLGWLLLLFTVTAIRFANLRRFWRAVRGPSFDETLWAQYFIAGAGAAGITWGIAGVLLFHPTSFPHQVFLAFVLGGMVAGGVPLLSSIRYAYFAFAIPIVMPISLQMLTFNSYVHFVMGLMIAIFGIVMLVSSIHVYRLFHDSEVLRRKLFSALELGQALEQLVRLDSLTGIPNRRFFEEELSKEWGRAERTNEMLSVIIADIDHFKEYNDRYGHPAGDDCLITVARTLQRALYRPTDIVARIGGEEFALILPRTNLEGALAVAEHLQERIIALNIRHDASPTATQITLSFGVSSSENGSASSPADLIRAADEALYEAKRLGRNRIEAQ